MDGRLDKQIYMTGISFNSASHIYLLAAEPSLEVALEHHIYSALAKTNNTPRFTKAKVTIEDLDLKNKVGFAKQDELYCEITSRLVTIDDAGRPGDRTVKTFAKNDKNMSPMVATSAKVILDQCVKPPRLVPRASRDCDC